MEEIKISVVVPSYNVEKYLPRLVDCILSQDEQSWEMILVNDGSKDNTGKVCDESALRDSRIKVIHQENQGLSGARNSGIKAAKGEWIAFIDADDLVSSTYLSSMLSAASVSDQIDLVFCSYAIIENTRTPIMLFNNATYIGNREISNAFSNTDLLLRCCAWARLYRRSVVIDNNIWYDTKVATEDRPFNYEYMKYLRGVATTATIGYFYGSFSPTTLKHKKHPVESYILRQKVLNEGIRELCKIYDLKGKGMFVIWRNLMKFLSESIEGAYYQMGCGKKTEKVQQSIMDECFDLEWHNEMMKNEYWRKTYENDQMLQLMIAGKFAKFNRTLKCKDANLCLCQIAHKLLRKKSPQASYDTAITMLN